MIADTSFLIALFLPEDELHEKAIEVLSKNISSIVIIDRVLEETFTVLCYKKGLKFCLEVIAKIKNNKDIILAKFDEKEINAIFNLAIKINKKISFVDYAVLYYQMTFGEGILCFDNELINISKALNKDK